MTPRHGLIPMDRRVQERRRSVTRDRGHRRATLVVVFVVALVAIALFLWLRSSDVFAVKRITYTAVEHVTTEEISRATEGAWGVSLLRLSTGAIEEDLSALPYIRSVEVYRRFPDTLDISLVEYEAVARLQADDGSVWFVASDGRALERTTAAGLPLMVSLTHVVPVAGKKVPSAIIGALPLASLLVEKETAASLPSIERIEVSPDGRVAVALDDGAE
ncbi:MAG: FtsQ-type POTRA domain-containing protein, partial [bacterium]